MKEIRITEKEAGQRLDKLLARILPNAQTSFLYKMMRKKNITLNGKKAAGKELLIIGDSVRVFFSDETYTKFSAKAPAIVSAKPLAKEQILYEDAHILVINKPAGVLSQKSSPKDISINEQLLAFCSRKVVFLQRTWLLSDLLYAIAWTAIPVAFSLPEKHF